MMLYAMHVSLALACLYRRVPNGSIDELRAQLEHYKARVRAGGRVRVRVRVGAWKEYYKDRVRAGGRVRVRVRAAGLEGVLQG